jgi:hypothetical protein
MTQRWALAIFSGIILSLLALYPQLNLKSLRGDAYNGAFASCDLDEMAYASYLQAIIDGRPRRNDPYTGRDDLPQHPQAESLFSVQFAGAYIAGVPARILGLSAAQMMPVISALSAFFTALALFWLVVSVTEDDLTAAAATLIVILGGAAVTGIGAINAFFEGGVAYPFFPFLRRYIPSVAFPFLFAFFACLFNGMKSRELKTRLVYGVLAAACFALLVFSYFYIWTAAAASLGGLLFFVLLFRGEEWRNDAIFIAATGSACALVIVPYAILLSNRNEMMDKAQLLVFTRRPDLFRTIEIVGYAVLIAAAILIWRRWSDVSRRALCFIAAFALTPVLVLNQQVITGHSLQPFHYEFYVVNYIVLLSAALLAAVLWRRFLSERRVISTVLAVILSVAAIGWGYVEASETTKFWDDVNVQRDEGMPVNRRLRDLAAGDIDLAKTQTTLNLEPLQADGQPTVAPQAVLWARHQHTFAGLESWEENKRRYYQLLYYSDLDANWLRKSLTNCSNIEACMALFGWDRFNARLSANARPLSHGEIENEILEYRRFATEFSYADAEDPVLNFAVISNEANDRLENLDRWYRRDAGEVSGKYTLYRLFLR